MAGVEGNTRRYKELGKNFGVLSIGSFASKAMSFFMVPLYTRVLSPSEYGVYNLITPIISILVIVLTLNISGAVLRFIMDRVDQKKDIISIGVFWTAIGSLLFTAFIILNSRYYFIKGIQPYNTYIILMYIFSSLNVLLNETAKANDQVKDISISGIIGTFSGIVFNLLFLLVIKLGLEGYFLANTLSIICNSMFLVVRLRLWKFFKLHINKELMKSMLIFTIPLAINQIGWWINNSADNYILYFFTSTAESGILAAAYKVPNIITTFTEFFLNAWNISVYSEYRKEGFHNYFMQSFYFFNDVCILGVGIIIMLSKPISRLLFAQSYYTAWKFMPCLLVSSFFVAISGFPGSILSLKYNSKAMMTAGLIGAGTNIVLNVVFIITIGNTGIVLATAISSFVILFFRLFFSRDDIPFHSIRKTVISWLFVMALALAETYFSNYIIEAIILFIIFGLTYKNILIFYRKIIAFIHNRGN